MTASDSPHPADDSVRSSGAGFDVALCGGTDRGKLRPVNQDYFLIGDLERGEIVASGPESRAAPEGVAEPETETVLASVLRAARRGPLMVVCDGMGGAAAGEVASKLAAETIWREMRASRATTRRAVYARHLRRAVRVANRRVFQESEARSELRGMGTTVSAAGVAGNVVILAQVGDSRAYVERRGRLSQVTRDQSVASALVREGQIEPERAHVMPHGHVILQALGVREDVEVAISFVDLRRGDRVLLCSDGLHGPLGDQALRDLLEESRDPADAVAALVAAAMAAGGPDNITALVCQVAGESLSAPEGDGDEVQFTELDPTEDGPEAIATTSRVARRLAARVGIGRDPGPPSVPATSQHSVVRASSVAERDEGYERDIAGPASAAYARRSRVSGMIWIALAVVALAVIAGIALDVL